MGSGMAVAVPESPAIKRLVGFHPGNSGPGALVTSNARTFSPVKNPLEIEKVLNCTSDRLSYPVLAPLRKINAELSLAH